MIAPSADFATAKDSFVMDLGLIKLVSSKLVSAFSWPGYRHVRGVPKEMQVTGDGGGVGAHDRCRH